MAANSRKSRKRKANGILHAHSTDTDDVSIEHERPLKKRKLGTSTTSRRDFIQFDIRSWAYNDKSPNRSHIKLTNNATQSRGLKKVDLQHRRGHRVIVINGVSGDIEQSIAFDTWADIYSGLRLSVFLKTLQFKADKWVIVVTHDSGYSINAEVACSLSLLKYCPVCD